MYNSMSETYSFWCFIYNIILDVVPVKKSALKYGYGNGTILLDDLDCRGNENHLLVCQRDKHNIAEHDCMHSEAAGVKCGGKEYSSSRTSSSGPL